MQAWRVLAHFTVQRPWGMGFPHCAIGGDRSLGFNIQRWPDAEDDGRGCLESPSLVRESTKNRTCICITRHDAWLFCVVTRPPAGTNDSYRHCLMSQKTSNRGTNYGEAEGLLQPRGEHAERLVRRSQKEHVCEESDDDMVLVKDRRGRVIGFERLNYLSAKATKGRREYSCRSSTGLS